MPQNDNFDWLTYETIFQQKRFSRTNARLELGLYSIPADKVTVFFRNYLDDEILQTLTEAIFPDQPDAKAHLKKVNSKWKWKEEAIQAAKFSITPYKIFAGLVAIVSSPYYLLKGSPDTNKAELPTYVVLPYNHLDNSVSSNALGTAQHAAYNLRRLKDEYKWQFWKTASRSSVMRINASVKNDGKTKWTERWQADYPQWDFTAGETARATFSIPAGMEPTAYQLNGFTKFDFSIKTGVVYVGIVDQGKNGKDNLDSNWIVACLRSDYVVEIDKKIKNGDKDYKNEIVVLTELLSVNEIDHTRVNNPKETRKDGIQVRDLTPLKKDKLYVPPLSIPFIGSDFKSVKSEFFHIDNAEWRDLWRQAWAKSLGRAKAFFLIRYGLQHINPNVQNYLIEFENSDKGPKPTGRIVIRDLQDAALQREVAWALFGNPSELPPTGDKVNLTGKFTLPVLSYEFEAANLQDAQETGTTDTTQFGPIGTQFLWQRFSTFASTLKLADFEERMKKDENRATLAKFAPSAADDSNAVKAETIKLLRDKNWDAAQILLVQNNQEASLPPQLQAIYNMQKRSATRMVAEKKVERTWKNFRNKFLTTMAEWGKSHNHEYVRTIENQLGVNLKIDWATVPDSQRYKDISVEPDYADMTWEEDKIKIVHDYLRSKAGQDALRAYHARRWEPAKPLFRLKFSSATNGIPDEEKPVKIRHKFDSAEIELTYLTDRKGEILFFQGKLEDCSIFFPNLNQWQKVLKLEEILEPLAMIENLNVEFLRA